MTPCPPFRIIITPCKILVLVAISTGCTTVGLWLMSFKHKGFNDLAGAAASASVGGVMFGLGILGLRSVARCKQGDSDNDMRQNLLNDDGQVENPSESGFLLLLLGMASCAVGNVVADALFGVDIKIENIVLASLVGCLAVAFGIAVLSKTCATCVKGCLSMNR